MSKIEGVWEKIKFATREEQTIKAATNRYYYQFRILTFLGKENRNTFICLIDNNTPSNRHLLPPSFQHLLPTSSLKLSILSLKATYFIFVIYFISNQYKVLSNQIDTGKKKVRNVEEIHRNLVLEFEGDPHFGLVENEGDYNSAVLGFPHGGPRIITLNVPPGHHPNHHYASLHSGGGSDLTFALLE